MAKGYGLHRLSYDGPRYPQPLKHFGAVISLNGNLFMPPALKRLAGHIAYILFIRSVVRSFIRMLVRSFVTRFGECKNLCRIYARVLKFHIWVSYDSLAYQ